MNGTHISAAGTITVTGGPTFLKRVAVNAPGAGATMALSSGSVVLGTITCGATITAANPFHQDYDVNLQNGLTVVTTGTLDATVVWGPQGPNNI